MGLVDYSDSDECEDATSPRKKKQRTSDDDATTTAAAAAKDVLPPLPSAFHDLYASTVRVSAGDDPALHQGRKRVNPHKAGHWPSHLYIEWHPTPTERMTLTTLLSTLQSNLTPAPSSPSAPSSPPSISISSFLTSDLGAPQPLHISLSRPIVLGTAQKDDFLSAVESSVRTSGIAPFELAPLGLRWHRTADSSRSFLVLRVGSRQPAALDKSERQADDGNDGDRSANPQLAPLLRRANALVTAFGQPALYALARRAGEGESADVDDAFHISIAWSFAVPSADLRRLTEEAFDSACDDDDVDTTIADAVRVMRVRVEGIKAKIGNIVTHIPLPDARSRRKEGSRAAGGGLFGI
ncbi:U6 snRNA phosphodiesterase Usb1 [Ustulina deusta]|nr:U6 snRNA phosphodiesterase Usb1 [Ustulina deusta]